MEAGLPRDWASLLPQLQEVINTTSNRQLPGYMTPFEVWFGRKPHWLFPNTLAEDR
jgi:hypothetical protein